MKKIECIFRERKIPGLQKVLRIMKLTVFLLLLSVINVFAGKSYSQTKELNLNMKNSSVKEVLRKIEDQSEFVFMYSEKLVDVNREVSMNIKNQKINDVLDKLFAGTDVNYKVRDRFILLSTSEVFETGLMVQQQPAVSGTVTDEAGEPLPGVTVVVKGTTQGTVTNADGEYNLTNLPEDATLVFSFVGMRTQEVIVGTQKNIDVVLEEDVIGIEEVVAIGYGTMKRVNLTGSVASVRSEDLVVAPVASTTNSLAGRLSGLISVQSSGQPGADAATLSIRGFGSPLVIVDGVETNFNDIDANQIESISILKDGGASIYGARAGNGVILVTTKRGNDSKPTISVNSSYTLQGITVMPKPVNAGQYAEMTSETWLNEGKPSSTVPYSEEEIQKYYNGTDPLYPNTNWYNVLIRDLAPQQQHNLSVRGGSDKIKYYGFIGYLNQESIWKQDGGNFSRYNLQSNINAKITDGLSLQLDIATVFKLDKSTWRPQIKGDDTVWQDFWASLPIYPATLPDPSKISFSSGNVHALTNRDLAGYNDFNGQNYKGTLSLNYNFKNIKGLSAKAFINIIQYYGSTKNFSKPLKYYIYDPASDTYTLAGALGSKASLYYYNNKGRTITEQLSATYDRTFATNHHIKAIVIYEAINYSSDYLQAARKNFLTPSIEQLFAGSTNDMSNNGSEQEMGRKSYIGRLNYSYKNKYLLEALLRADASAKFPANKRWGYFPGVSIGWRISEEDFIKKFNSIDNLKIRSSYGESGNDGVGNFQYLAGYQYGKTYPLDGTAQQGIVSKGLANPNLTWEKIKLYNLGVDFSIASKKLYGESDLFYRTRKGIPATRSNTLPSTFGSALPPENINSLNDRGFEFMLGHSGQSGNFSWDISANISWSRSKWDHYEEPDYQDPLQKKIYKRSGRWTDVSYGYTSDKLFTSQDEIDNLLFDQDGQNNNSLNPGDVKYKDTNEDGKLDWKDQVEIGKGATPHWMTGMNINFNYKHFSMAALFQGAFGYYKFIQLQQGKVYPVVMYNKRWTQENNNPNALIPRLGGSYTNAYYSDRWYKKAGYLRLKAFNIAYTVPENLLNNINVKELRIYIAATNLFTLDKLKEFNTDPEAPSGYTGYYYPQQKTITLGINVTL